ncbi:MAG TPA: MBL fold metallo-hydrolase [Thermomicrobiales bacterium]|nr:MBL fold metallo-hydrolase [Thermomicrobiales bacterium]
MNIRLLRHATIVVDWGDVSILVDPMLAEKDALDPIPNAANTHRIPMLPLPVDDDALQQIIAGVDGVFVTHTHRDHWDARASELIPHETPMVCQPPDFDRFSGEGYNNLITIQQHERWHGFDVTRTGGQHGTGEIGARMGPVSGFVFRAAGQRTLYIAGDTVWCPEFEDALREHAPDVIVLNAGAAQFNVGDPITMTAEDVMRVANTAPNAKIVAVHMDTINHCLLTRAMLTKVVADAGLSERVLIPGDGETIAL